MPGQPHFDIRQASDGQHYWVLVAANGEPLGTGETHPTRQGAERSRDATIAAALATQAIDLQRKALAGAASAPETSDPKPEDNPDYGGMG
jgi:uncharacterized protein YegP (UPF0339 family)